MNNLNIENKYERGIKSALKNFLSEDQKNKKDFNLVYQTVEKTKNDNIGLTFNFMNNFTLFSEINKEIYFLFKNLEHLKDSKEVFYEYTLVTYILEEQDQKVKSIKKIKFYIDNTEIKNINISDIFLHPLNQNQICFFSTDYLAFIPNAKEFTLNEEREKSVEKIEIIHFSTNCFKDFKKFKFSNYDNYFGILFLDNSFRFYSINSRVSEFVIQNLPQNLEEIVDFEFGPILTNSWLNFSLFFITKNGKICYTCPIIPWEFNISKAYIENMKNYTKMLKDDEESQDNVKNERLILQLELLNKNGKVEVDEVLKRLNSTLEISNFVILDKREPSDIFLLNNKNEIDFTYKQIHILKMYPLTILRISNFNTIDVIVCLDDISPLRKTTKIPFEPKDCYLLETIYLRNYLTEKLSVKNYEKINEKIKLNFLNSQNNSILINYANDILEIEFPYLKYIAQCYSFYNNSELKLNFKCNKNKILCKKFINKGSFFNVGYYGIIPYNKKVGNSNQMVFEIITIIENKFCVREISKEYQEQEEIQNNFHLFFKNKLTLKSIEHTLSKFRNERINLEEIEKTHKKM